MTIEQLSARLIEDIENDSMRHSFKQDKNFIHIIFNSAEGDILISYRISKELYKTIKKNER